MNTSIVLGALPPVSTSGLVGLAILALVYLLIIGFVLWVAGEVVVGRRVTYVQALGIAIFGTALFAAAIFLLPGLIGLLAAFLLFLLVVKFFFRTGWFGALGVAVVSVIVVIVLSFILGAIGFALRLI